MSIKTISEALHEALRGEMLRDPRVFTIGEECGFNGLYGVSTDLEKEFGSKRVIATPISEAGFVGMSVGAAMRGMRPVAELMYIDFIGVCMDQIINQAAKMCYMTGGQIGVPMVLRLPMGSGRRNAGQHSQNLESLLTHIPGLKVVAPITPYDAKGMLTAAIRDEDPVVMLEHKLCYNIQGEVPEGDYTVPFGQAAVRREGTDVTLIGWSRQVLNELEAAETLEKEGISAEVVDIRSLVPLDFETIAASVTKTGRALVAQECVNRGGYGGEISAQISENLFDRLKAPVMRIGAKNIVPPFAHTLEDAFFPNTADIVSAVREMMKKEAAVCG
ncbi:alpha-ketoacid dehydrogenase subunit beta [Oscillibacter sp.]|jgi:pyruvate/2-oxoglutarate/acetoin dehydrogenase E1 component|uniref:alpha-ketoacid dehydrogenase subunit beta n=1 Tax=Oscillibacter sp. TaxID=1945593 RepID=UPI00216D91D3|nr:alpha-ketoacid dehydrogenase subunit beta [Oscillibacter sp.]MCI9648859.1 alpha-ketoacid dehydrogenase subunit beta [Oscillibacter sp.]